MNILTTNCFLKDFEDPNPYVRRLVIKTVCHIPCLHELAFQLLPLAFCDSSSYVRSTAASSCTLMINEDNLESKQSIIDKLYDMIRDPDPSVISSSLAALDVILSSEGGVVINARLFRYLVSRIVEFQEWHFATVSRVLKKYIPRSSDELLHFLNALDDNLSDSNPLIFTLASDLALFYISSLKENFSSDIIEQIAPQVKFLFNHCNDELLYEILESLHRYMKGHEKYFIPFYKLLFCRFSDPTFIKVKKLQIIIDLGNSSNVLEITEELLVYSSYSVKEVAVQSIKSFIKFLLLHPVSSSAVECFVQLMDIQHNSLNEEVLIAVCTSELEKRDDFKNVFLPAVSKRSSRVSSVHGKLALLKLIANHGKYIERSPYVIEDLLNDSENLENENIMMMIITASVKLFLLRPAEMQLLLGRILQISKQSENLLLRKQSTIYYHLLNDTSLSKKLLLTESEEF